MTDRSDVIVIGGGIIGCWTAWHLARLGRKVTLLERNRIGSGASSGNCGYICPSHVHPLCGPGAVVGGLRTMARFGGALSIPPRWDPVLWRWLLRFAQSCNADHFHNASIARHALLKSSREQYQQFAAQNADGIRWQEKGLLTVYQSRRDFEAYQEQASQLASEFQIRIDRYDGDDICNLEPCLREGLAGGWYFPGDAHVSPVDLLTQLRREIEAAGGVIREQTEIDEFSFDGHAVSAAKTNNGDRLQADAFVVTTGAESATLAKQLDFRIPVVPGKGYSVTLNTATDLPATPMIFEQDHVAVTPLGDSFRIGSTMQLTGFSRSIPESRIELLKRSAREHLRDALPVADETKWCGWRPMMPDDLPCIDRSPRAGNAFVAAGNGMIGMATGPATGQLVAEMITETTPHIDPNPYRVSRFQSTG